MKIIAGQGPDHLVWLNRELIGTLLEADDKEGYVLQWTQDGPVRREGFVEIHPTTNVCHALGSHCLCDDDSLCKKHQEEWQRVSDTERKHVVAFLKLEGAQAQAILDGKHLVIDLD